VEPVTDDLDHALLRGTVVVTSDAASDQGLDIGGVDIIADHSGLLRPGE
jgi:hypothetical protein